MQVCSYIHSIMTLVSYNFVILDKWLGNCILMMKEKHWKMHCLYVPEIVFAFAISIMLIT